MLIRYDLKMRYISNKQNILALLVRLGSLTLGQHQRHSKSLVDVFDPLTHDVDTAFIRQPSYIASKI
jgi:hypothetical protein